MTVIRRYRVELILAVVALVVHLGCFLFVVHANDGHILNAVRGDDGFYELAENILAGNGFSWSSSPPYAPNPLRTPGYSYVLALLIGLFGIGGAIGIQMLAASVLPPLGMQIAERMTRSRKMSIAVGAILALDPTLALLSFQFYTETLFLLLFFLWILASLRYLEKRTISSLIMGALLLGCAILVKASVQYIPFLFVAFVLWQHGTVDWRRGVAHASIYLLFVGALVAPWIIRNTLVFSVPGLSAQAPFVLYTNLAPAVRSVANGTTLADELQAFLTKEEFRGDAITLANGDVYTARALEVVRAHPDATLFVAGKSLFTFFTNDGMYTLLARSGYEPREYLPLLVIARLLWIAITLAAFIGAAFFIFTERSLRAVFLVLLVAYFALTSIPAAFGTNPRYRLPIDPIFIALATVGGTYMLTHIRRRMPTSARTQSPSV
ncbi:MAG: glycosyltransferase family 39 protein [Patescibacteria group bacterium]